MSYFITSLFFSIVNWYGYFNAISRLFLHAVFSGLSVEYYIFSSIVKDVKHYMFLGG